MHDTLLLNGYPQKFLQEVEKKRVMMQEKVRPPEELVKEFFDLVEPQTSYRYAILPYIKGLTEPLERTLKHHDIRVATKPLRTLHNYSLRPKTNHHQKTRLTSFTKSTAVTAHGATLAKLAEHLTQGERNT